MVRYILGFLWVLVTVPPLTIAFPALASTSDDALRAASPAAAPFYIRELLHAFPAGRLSTRTRDLTDRFLRLYHLADTLDDQQFENISKERRQFLWFFDSPFYTYDDELEHRFDRLNRDMEKTIKDLAASFDGPQLYQMHQIFEAAPDSLHNPARCDTDTCRCRFERQMSDAVSIEIVRRLAPERDPELDLRIVALQRHCRNLRDQLVWAFNTHEAHKNMPPDWVHPDVRHDLDESMDIYEDRIADVDREVRDLIASNRGSAEQREQLLEIKNAVSELPEAPDLHLSSSDERMADLAVNAGLLFTGGMAVKAAASGVKYSAVAVRWIRAGRVAALTAHGAPAALEGDWFKAGTDVLSLCTGATGRGAANTFSIWLQNGVGAAESIDMTWNRSGFSESSSRAIDNAAEEFGLPQEVADAARLTIAFGVPAIVAWRSGRILDPNGCMGKWMNGHMSITGQRALAAGYLPTFVGIQSGISYYGENRSGRYQGDLDMSGLLSMASEIAWGTSPYATTWIHLLKTPNGQMLAIYMEGQEFLEDLDPSFDALMDGYPVLAGNRLLANLTWDVPDPQFPITFQPPQRVANLTQFDPAALDQLQELEQVASRSARDNTPIPGRIILLPVRQNNSFNRDSDLPAFIIGSILGNRDSSELPESITPVSDSLHR